VRPSDVDSETESFKIEEQSIEKPVGTPVQRAGGTPVKKPAGKPARKPPAAAARSKGGEEMKLHSEMLPPVPVSMSPLDEYPRVRQIEGEGFRRWFTNGYFDLIVWYKDDKTTLVGFQLCFESKALTWTVERGYDLSAVDDGEQGAAGSSKMTPVLVAGGHFKPRVVAQRFHEASVSIDRKLADFIAARIIAFRC
jgi:hypothetical protein